MLVNKKIREELYDLFLLIKLQDRNASPSIDKQVKIEQIIGYLELVHAKVRQISKKRKIILIDSGAGNCYLSYLFYYYYTKIDDRAIEIHCIDNNEKLMQKNTQLAKKMGFDAMYFHADDINDFNFDGKVDMVYSLHACDTATDKTMYLGIRLGAKFIFSVACCQKTLSIKSKSLKSVIRHKSFREKTLMMIADSLRALLLEQSGYKVDIFDFVSSRYTDKNTMLRAVKSTPKKDIDFAQEYEKISTEFKMRPYLEKLLLKAV